MTYWCEFAWLPTGVARNVRIDIEDGRVTDVRPDQPAGSSTPLRGITVPGFANTHSHAFHRALRGRTHSDGGTFWTWRERMYHVAAQLNPDNYLALARATYAEMALAGVTSVGEFHYVHHQPDGTPYADPNAMGRALQQAAREAGIRLTLLDTCYLAGGLTADGHQPLGPQQRRFGDGDVDGWIARAGQLRPDEGFRVGAALHSVRAVPAEQLRRAAEVIDPTWPVHAHVSEQPAENTASLAFYDRTPVELLHQTGLLTERFTAVHATHLTSRDIALLAQADAVASFCPTTERDLADGIGPAKALYDNGVRISLGSDQHAVIDLLEDARAVELHERLTSHERGRFAPADLMAMATRHATIGWPEAGAIAPGAAADLVTIALDTPRTAGADPAQIITCATAADIRSVIRDGEPVVTDGRHHLGDIGGLLHDAIAPFWEDV
ncbi:formimidoylglutamate deiminase [Metallococcus carri]|uniref:formimidoylglutamate deiminase n=1 Tax=Metallococcus carri TaxID=1656884 RepID=UPI001492FD68|nr:formimidoylglutamate deiminase [Metallococcus carri]